MSPRRAPSGDAVDRDTAAEADDEMMADSPFRRAAVEFHATRDRGTKRPAFAVPHAKYVAVALGAALAAMVLIGLTTTVPTVAQVPVADPADRGAMDGGPYLFAVWPADDPVPLRPGTPVRLVVPGGPAEDLRVGSVARRVDGDELGARFGLLPPATGADRLWSVAVVPWEAGGAPPQGGDAHLSVETGRQTVAAYVVDHGKPATSTTVR